MIKVKKPSFRLTKAFLVDYFEGQKNKQPLMKGSFTISMLSQIEEDLISSGYNVIGPSTKVVDFLVRTYT